MLGAGVPKNILVAIYWLQQAAKSDDIKAEINLGKIYADPKNQEIFALDTAKDWFKKAADQGSEDAKNYLASLTPVEAPNGTLSKTEILPQITEDSQAKPES